MKTLAVILLSCFFVLDGVNSQVPGLFGCPNPSVKPDFKLAQYTGIWYEIERYFPIFFELGTKCGQATYTAKEGGKIKVENKGINRFTGSINDVVGEAYAKNASEPAKLTVNFPVAGPFATGPYWVLNTDYTSYSIVYSCSALDRIAHADIVWILGRKKFIPENELQRIRSYIQKLGLRTKFLVKQDQTDCNSKQIYTGDGKNTIL